MTELLEEFHCGVLHSWEDRTHPILVLHCGTDRTCWKKFLYFLVTKVTLKLPGLPAPVEIGLTATVVVGVVSRGQR